MTRIARSMLLASLLASHGALGQDGPSKGKGSGEAPALRPATVFDSTVERSELRESALQTLTGLATRSEAAQVRANAIEALQIAPGRAESVIRAGLRDPSLGVRFAAAFSAGRLRMKSLVGDLRPLLADRSKDVQAAAIFALTRCGEEIDPTPLADMLGSGDVRLRANVVMLLGEMENPSAAPMLRAAAAKAPTPGTAVESKLLRLQVAEALYRLGEKTAIDPIRAALYPVGPEDVEAAALAAQIIGNVGDKESATTLKNRALDVVSVPEHEGKASGKAPYLLPPEVRLAAVTALGKIGLRDGVYVADQFARDRSPAIRAQAAFAYGETGSKADLPKVEFLLQDPSELVRVAAAGAAVKVVDRAADSGR